MRYSKTGFAEHFRPASAMSVPAPPDKTFSSSWRMPTAKIPAVAQSKNPDVAGGRRTPSLAYPLRLGCRRFTCKPSHRRSPTVSAQPRNQAPSWSPDGKLALVLRRGTETWTSTSRTTTQQLTRVTDDPESTPSRCGQGRSSIYFPDRAAAADLQGRNQARRQTAPAHVQGSARPRSPQIVAAFVIKRMAPIASRP